MIGVDIGGNNTRLSRYANYLRDLLLTADTTVMEMAAAAMGQLALASGTYTSEYVEFETKRAFEWLSGVGNEDRRHAAVSLTFKSIYKYIVQLVYFSYFVQYS